MLRRTRKTAANLVEFSFGIQRWHCVFMRPKQVLRPIGAMNRLRNSNLCIVYKALHSELPKLSVYDYRHFFLSLKALVNEDTMLRTHCCPWCFLGRANWETFVADTECFWTKSETFFVSRTQNLCPQQCGARGQTGKHLCRQQCVRNNVSSFARAFKVIPQK